MSARQSTLPLLFHCSGAMYVGVPIEFALPVRLMFASFAMPKSRILTRSPRAISASRTR